MGIPERIVLEVTEACPQNCVHCYNFWQENRKPLSHSRSLTRKEIRYVVTSINKEAPLKQIAISGGEPLLRQDLPGIVADIAELGITPVIITSGILLTPDNVKKFPHGTLFEITLFSSDSVIHEKITGLPGSFKNVIRGAAAVIESGRYIAAGIVIDKLNHSEMRKAIQLGIAIGCDGFLLNRMNYSGHTFMNNRMIAPDAAELKHALDEAEETAGDFGINIAVAVPVPPCVVDLTPYKNLHFGWCPRGDENSYYTIGFDGMLRPCNHSSLILGDVRKQSFLSLISSSRAKEFWGVIPDKCRGCSLPMGNLCRGGCPAASDECFGTRGIRDPYAELFASDGQQR